MAQTSLDRPQQQAQPAPRQNLAEVFYRDLDEYTPNLKDALPADIPVERFKRVLVTAVSTNPELLYADRRSLFNAAMRCAVDGLLPDGRQAALVVFRTDVKRRNPETGIDHVQKIDMAQYMPMVAGLRERMRKSGEVASATAEAVFEKDHFRYRLGDDALIEHEPPPLGVSRGAVIGAYAIIRLRNGEVIRDVLDRQMIEAARNVSRAKNSPMWTNFYWEGAKKTALRRAAKQAPFSSELRRVLDRDDEAPEIGPDPSPGMLPRQPEPQREHYQIGRVEPTGPEFAVVDLDGIENIYGSAGAAAEALRLGIDEAARLGPDRLEGWWESNQTALDFMAGAGYAEESRELIRAYEAHTKPADRPIPSGQQGPGPAAQQARVEPDRGASPAPRRGRPPRTTESPAAEAPTQEQAPHAPPTGAVYEAPDHRMPPTEEPPPVDLLIEKKPDIPWRTWAIALLAPKMRRCVTGNALADLLGANEVNLEQARAPGSMTPAELAEMERIIAEQWGRLPAR
jgi:recombination protein RecT